MDNGDVAKRWQDLSERTRRWIVVLGAVEGALKTAALADLRRRRPDEVNGSRLKWALAIVVVNSAGTVPIAYFLYGRRRTVGRYSRS